MEPVSLDQKRKEKQTRCTICGGISHDYAGQCPRIYAITEEPDGGVTYHLTDIDDPPLAG